MPRSVHPEVFQLGGQLGGQFVGRNRMRTLFGTITAPPRDPICIGANWWIIP